MSLISYQEALAQVLNLSINFSTEIVCIDDALNRVIAEDILADRDYPPFNRAAMDGIAVNSKDLEKGITIFKIIEKIYAGNPHQIEISEGECYKIMTGSAVPPKANFIIKIEDVIINDNTAVLHQNQPLNLNSNISCKGQDLKLGEVAIPIGTFISPSIIGLLASLGRKEIIVKNLPNVKVITTGNEVFDVDANVNDYQIRNSNKYVLSSLLKQNLIKDARSIHILDDKYALLKEIKYSLHYDILIITGGVSAGDADYIPEILNDLGVEKLFHKVAIKPGKPVWCGKKSGGAMVFALPGNPLSCLVTFKIFVEPYIKKFVGINSSTVHKAKVNFSRIKRTIFNEFFPVFFGNNQLSLMPLNGSGDIRLGEAANAIALQENEMIQKEDEISYIII